MNYEEAELIIEDQDKNTKEILKVIEKEKCELLGIIQGKDKVIKDLEWQLQEVLEDNDNYQKENETLKKQLEALSGDIPWKELKDVSEVTKKLTEAKEILQVVLDKWEENRWILQSDEEIKQIENLMEQAENFLKECK